MGGGKRITTTGAADFVYETLDIAACGSLFDIR